MNEDEKQYDVMGPDATKDELAEAPKVYATLADLTEASQIEEKLFEELGPDGMWVKWNKFMAIDRQMSLIAKYNMAGRRKGKRDMRGLFLEVASTALIEPKVTGEQVKLLGKASGKVIAHIVNSVMVMPEEEQMEWEEEWGE